MSHKTCSACNETKPIEGGFYNKKHGRCRVCYTAHLREKYNGEPETRIRRLESAAKYRSDPAVRKRRRDHELKRRMNITAEERDARIVAQGNVCPICERTPTGPGAWHVDHDHACCPENGKSCGKCIRAILCADCNRMLGSAHEDRQTLLRAIDYLNEWQVKRAPKETAPPEPAGGQEA